MSRNAKTNQFSQILKLLLLRKNGGIAVGRLVAIVGVLLLYLVLQPWISNSFGVDLPGFRDLGTLVGINSPEKPQPKGSTPGKPNTSANEKQAASNGNGKTNRSGAAENSPKGVTLQSFFHKAGRDVYISPAGLRYTRGSKQGHRMKHVLEHAKDSPNRPGSHGVFDANSEVAVFQLLDEAYLQAKSGRKTKTKREGSRTVYTVDLGRKIGYVGGQSGKRRSHPPARFIRLVIDGEAVITAFPTTN